MYCVKCGNQLLPEARFCTSCGGHVDTANAVPDIQGVGDNVTHVTPAQPSNERRLHRIIERRLDMIFGLVAVLLLAGGKYWYDAERNIVRAPEYKVGDKWTFEYPLSSYSSDLYSHLPKAVIERLRSEHESEATYEVTKGNDLEHYAKKITGKLDGFEGLPRLLWDSIKTRNGRPYPFPLQPGKTWEEQDKIVEPEFNVTTIYTYKVGEWETLTVPAGTFRVIPITLTYKSHYEASSKSPYDRSGTLNVDWYAPDAKIEVKSTSNGEVISQLKAYSVQ